MRSSALLLFVLFTLVACSGRNKVPKGVLPPLKMQEVFWDMISAGEFLNGYVLIKDSVDRFAKSSEMYGKVLQFHEISREQFDKSYLFYRQHPELMKVILDTLSKRQLEPEKIIAERPDTVQQIEPVDLADTLKNPDTPSKKIRKVRTF